LTTGVTTRTVDWTVLDLDGVTDVARSASARVATQYRHITEYGDLLHDAYLNLAHTADQVREYLSDPTKGLGFLHHRLWCDLVDSVRNEANRRTRHVPYEILRAEEARAPTPVNRSKTSCPRSGITTPPGA
jgi:hypothetical protein